MRRQCRTSPRARFTIPPGSAEGFGRAKGTRTGLLLHYLYLPLFICRRQTMVRHVQTAGPSAPRSGFFDIPPKTVLPTPTSLSPPPFLAFTSLGRARALCQSRRVLEGNGLSAVHACVPGEPPRFYRAYCLRFENVSLGQTSAGNRPSELQDDEVSSDDFAAPFTSTRLLGGTHVVDNGG